MQHNSSLCTQRDIWSVLNQLHAAEMVLFLFVFIPPSHRLEAADLIPVYGGIKRLITSGCD